MLMLLSTENNHALSYCRTLFAWGGAAPTANVVMTYALAAFGTMGISANTYFKFYATHPDDLPTFSATAEEVIQAAHDDIDTLVTVTSHRVIQDAKDISQQNERIHDATTCFEANLATMKASLEKLPELLQNNREKQALRVENARLLVEREGYASRAESLLGLLEKKHAENENLHTQVDGLEAKVAGLALQMDKLITFAHDKQREIAEIRRQSKEHTAEKQITGTHFSLNLFS